MTRTSTRAGRTGASSDRKSRTRPACRQNGQASGPDGVSGPGGETGASHAGQDSVPIAMTHERSRRWTSCGPLKPRTGSGSKRRNSDT